MESVPEVTKAHQDRPGSERGCPLTVLCILFSILTVAFAGLRVLRNIKIRKHGYEEVLVIGATLLSVAMNCILVVADHDGNGSQIDDIPPAKLASAIQLPWISQPLSAFALLCAKASIGITLLRLGLGRTFGIVVLTTTFIVSAGNVWAGVSVLTSCSPTAHKGTGSLCRASAIVLTASYFQAGVNIYADLVFFLAPEVFLRRIKLSAQARMTVRWLLGFMLLASVMSICKITQLPTVFGYGDITWNVVTVLVFSVSEIGLSIMAACLPAIRQLITMFAHNDWSLSRNDDDDRSRSLPTSETDTELKNRESKGTRNQVTERSGTGQSEISDCCGPVQPVSPF